MLSHLRKHHIGIIVSPKDILSIEQEYGKKFHIDKIQGSRVMFIEDEELRIYKELIVQEGRAKNIPTGFYHVCYSVDSKNELDKLELFIKEKKLGYPVTQLEKSGSKECGWIKFFFIKNLGFIEINLIKN